MRSQLAGKLDFPHHVPFHGAEDAAAAGSTSEVAAEDEGVVSEAAWAVEAAAVAAVAGAKSVEMAVLAEYLKHAGVHLPTSKELELATEEIDLFAHIWGKWGFPFRRSIFCRMRTLLQASLLICIGLGLPLTNSNFISVQRSLKFFYRPGGNRRDARVVKKRHPAQDRKIRRPVFPHDFLGRGFAHGLRS